MNQEISSIDIESLRIRIDREHNYIEVAKLQKELSELETLYDAQCRKRLEEIENDGSGFIGSN